MKTKIQLVSMAFDELRINGITSSADSEDEKLAMQSLEQLVSELQIDIGWRFEPEPDPNTMSGIPLFAESAIYMALAVRIAPRYGKDAGMIRTQAMASMSALVARVKKPRQINYSTRMPIGLGNRRQFPFSRQFMPQIDEAPNSVNTETFVIGDSRPVSVDLTDFMQPNEIIDSYSLTPTSGLLVSDESTAENVISFTVTAQSLGYQVIVIAVTGDAGTISNQRLDFQIDASQPVRGNP
jgi:hypothetical protein